VCPQPLRLRPLPPHRCTANPAGHVSVAVRARCGCARERSELYTLLLCNHRVRRPRPPSIASRPAPPPAIPPPPPLHGLTLWWIEWRSSSRGSVQIRRCITAKPNGKFWIPSSLCPLWAQKAKKCPANRKGNKNLFISTLLACSLQKIPVTNFPFDPNTAAFVEKV
jgi:hypothetical protein